MNDPLFDQGLDERPVGKNGVPADWDARVRRELRRGERLLWVGQPRPALFARQELAGFVFGIVWTAFCLFLATFFILLHGKNGPKNDPLTGSLVLGAFLLIGLWMLSLPYWARRKAKRTCYAITDRRAILWEAGSFGKVEIRSYRPEHLIELFRVEYPGGGDLVFEDDYTITMNTQTNDREQVRVRKKRGFMGIERVQEVEEFLRRKLLIPDD